MRHIVLASHGTLAESFKETCAMIVGKDQAQGINVIEMTVEKSPAAFSEEAKTIIQKDSSGEYLILADLQGASPCNTCCLAFRNQKYRLITGLNLGMVLEAVLTKDQGTLDDLFDRVASAGQESIQKYKTF